MEALQITYLPLVSQQFRLRDLVKVTGYNVGEAFDDSKEVQYHYTIHKNAGASPLFTSAKSSRCLEPTTTTTPWPDVKKDFGANSPLKAIVIRLHRTAATDLTSPPDVNPDQVISTLGVHFSGLIPFSDRLVPRLRSNTLVFHTRSGFRFVAPGSIAADDMQDGVVVAENGEKMKEGLVEQLRYTFIESENVKCGCSLDQLLKLQQGQLRLKYKRELLRSLIMEIRSTSGIAMEDNDDDENNNVKQAYYHHPRSHHHHHQSHGGGSMGKTLTKLLNMEPERVDPKTLAAAYQLRMSVEAARARCRLLSVERDRARRYVENLEARLATNCDRNVETDSLILTSYHDLSKEKEKYLHLKLTLTKNLETLATTRGDLRLLKQSLLRELNEIYDIAEHSGGQFTINSIMLPDAEAYENTHVPATSISVALGYVAHMVLVTATVLDVPLRNKILFKGSHSQIMGQLQILSNNV